MQARVNFAPWVHHRQNAFNPDFMHTYQPRRAPHFLLPSTEKTAASDALPTLILKCLGRSEQSRCFGASGQAAKVSLLRVLGASRRQSGGRQCRRECPLWGIAVESMNAEVGRSPEGPESGKLPTSAIGATWPEAVPPFAGEQ